MRNFNETTECLPTVCNYVKRKHCAKKLGNNMVISSFWTILLLQPFFSGTKRKERTKHTKDPNAALSRDTAALLGGYS